MSDYSEKVFRASPLSLAAIEQVATEALSLLQPTMLTRPEPIDVAHWIDTALLENGVFVFPARATDLQDAEGLTYPTEGGRTHILINEDIFAGLNRGGRRLHRLRSTLAHEVAHAILHMRLLMRSRQLQGLGAFARIERKDLRAYEDPEWQAFALGGAMMVPRAALNHLRTITPATVATAFGISEAFALRQLKRYRIVT